MKSVLLTSLLTLQFLAINAQVLCDSTFAVCDSLFIDTIFISHTEFGDRLHLKLQTDYASLYAPSFLICPEDEEILFTDPDFGLFGIGGPTAFYIFYQFENFTSVGDTLSGHLVVNISNTDFYNCSIPFALPSDIVNSENELSIPNKTSIFPNPVTDHFYINKPTSTEIQFLQLFNSSGKEQNIIFDNDKVILPDLPPGIYILKMITSGSRPILKKIIKY